MKKLICVLIMSVVGAFAQVAAPAPYVVPDQAVFLGGQYDQASTPSATGFVGYAKKITDNSLSYTKISETSITISKKLAIQTTTETGICVYTTTFASAKVFTCGTAGVATTNGSVGFAGGGSLLITKPVGTKGWFVGGTGGPSYSAVSGKVTYPLGVLVGYSTSK